MRPSYHPRLVNGPFGDPGLFVPFLLHKQAFLFDLGDIHALSPRDILKLTHVFVSHTHMDHFVGFDHLLRLFLGRDKQLHLFGPRGFLKNIEGKLAGYTWNLVDHYKYRFTLKVTEINSDHLQTRVFSCQSRFNADGPEVTEPFKEIISAEPSRTVSSVVLDHKIDSLGFSLSETCHINILKTGLERLNLPIGPWIRRFKKKLYARENPESQISIDSNKIPGKKHVFQLGTLAKAIARITPGQKISYITDAAGHSPNMEKMIHLAKEADHLFIEAPFLHKDKHLAEKTFHLTARQAGRVARKAGVRKCTLFHFSPRYTDSHHLLEQEAAQSAGATVEVMRWHSGGQSN